MPLLTELYRPSLLLLTDLYQLTMFPVTEAVEIISVRSPRRTGST